MTQESTLQNKPSAGLLMVIAPPSLEEMLVDALLQQTQISGFTSSKVNGHGSEHAENGAQLSIVEQVTGRQQRIQFMMHASVEDLKNLTLALKARFKNADIHYILLPVLDC